MSVRTNILLFLFIATALLWSVREVLSLRTEYSVDQFYPSEHALLRGHDKITEDFRLHQNSPFLFIIEGGEDAWVSAKNIQRLIDTSNEIEGREDVSGVLSLTHIEGASTDKNEMVIGNIFDRFPKQTWKEKILQNSLLFPFFVTRDLSSTLVSIEPKVKDQRELDILGKEAQQFLKKKFPEFKIHRAGVPLLQSKLSGLIQSELSLFLLFAGFAFCGVFYLLFSHHSAIVFAFITLIATNLFGLALMSGFGIPMNAILVTLPIIISVSIMSVLVHTLHLWSHRGNPLASYAGRSIAAYATLKEIFLPNSLGIFTTALGFLALAPSAIPLISQYGVTVAGILTLVALLSQVILLLGLPFVTPKMRPWFNGEAKWATLPLRSPKLILILLLALSVLGMSRLPTLNFSAKLFDDLPRTDEARKTTEWIDRAFGGILTFDVTGTATTEGFWKDPEVIQRLNSLTVKIKKDSPGTVVTVSDFFQGNIPETRGQIAETFFLFSMAQKNPLNSFMIHEGKSLRLAIRLPDLPSSQLDPILQKIRTQVRSAFPEISWKEGGMASYAHAINLEVTKALIFDFWQPLLLIGLALVFIFRSFKWALLSCLPNFIPPAFLIGALSWSQVPVKPGVALIFSIALGFAFNNTLYLLTRLRERMNYGSADPLKDALLMEGNPCFFESLLMFVGFSLFLTSDFNMNQTFGGFMLISILAGFVADLYFLPAFIKVFMQTKSRPKALGFTFMLVFTGTSFAAPSAQEILKKSQSLLDAKDDEARIEMKIIEQNGEVKNRSLNLQTRRDEGFSVLARIQSPADIKDMAFLGKVDQEGNEMQWIFLPSSNQVRRLVTGESKAGLLGSEISPEDLNSDAIKSSSVKLIKTDEKFHWLELTPKAGTSDYTRVVTQISKQDLLPKTTSYFIQAKLKKTVDFIDYIKVGSVFRAQLMKVKNHLNGRGTEVRLSQIKVNSGLSADVFSQSNLKED